MKIIEELDTSMMNDFRKCPRYFELRHVEYLVPKMNSAKSIVYMAYRIFVGA